MTQLLSSKKHMVWHSFVINHWRFAMLARPLFSYIRENTDSSKPEL